MITSKESRPKGIECRFNIDGSDNPKYVDLLDEDKPVAGQKFACLSFVSPEKIVRQKELFFFEQFLKNWDLKKSMEKFTQFLNFVSYKYSLTFEDVMDDFKEFAKDEKDNIIQSGLEDDYKNYLDEHEDNLEKDFGEMCGFQTATRGLKVRGVFPNQQEAELRCKLLRELDPNHDVYVGPVGMWVPFHPDAYKTGRVEYLEDELNQLMHEKQKNEKKAKIEFDQRIKEAKIKAMEENKEKAEKSGNLLSQTINKEGDLISVQSMNTVERNLGDGVTTADIRKELFEGDNVVTTANTDHGLGDLQNVKFTTSDVEITENTDEQEDEADKADDKADEQADDKANEK